MCIYTRTHYVYLSLYICIYIYMYNVYRFYYHFNNICFTEPHKSTSCQLRGLHFP